ncbi:hypothetical protein PACG_05451, partial [Pseudomonas aeruginosa C3719]
QLHRTPAQRFESARMAGPGGDDRAFRPAPAGCAPTGAGGGAGRVRPRAGFRPWPGGFARLAEARGRPDRAAGNPGLADAHVPSSAVEHPRDRATQRAVEEHPASLGQGMARAGRRFAAPGLAAAGGADGGGGDRGRAL